MVNIVPKDRDAQPFFWFLVIVFIIGYVSVFCTPTPSNAPKTLDSTTTTVVERSYDD